MKNARAFAVSALSALSISCGSSSPPPQEPKPPQAVPSATAPPSPGSRVSTECKTDRAAAEARAEGYGMVHRDDPSRSDGGAPVNGRLPPEVIQKIIREHYGTFRACYEAGLQRDRNLRGVLMTKFVIEKTGSVGVQPSRRRRSRFRSAFRVAHTTRS